MNGRTDGQTNEQTDGQTDGWMDERTDGRTDGLTDGLTNCWTFGRSDKKYKTVKQSNWPFDKLTRQYRRARASEKLTNRFYHAAAIVRRQVVMD